MENGVPNPEVNVDVRCESNKLISPSDAPVNGSTDIEEGDSDPPVDVAQVKEGGYGFIIVPAAFVLFFVTGSILASQGMFYPAFREAFSVKAETVGWFLSLAGFTQGLCSLFCGSVVDRYGSRKVCLVGCLLQSLGMLISSFAPNIYLLYVTYTLLWGPGLGMIFTSGPVIIQRWFTKNRSLAHSLAIIGVPCGEMTSGPLTYALELTYGWRGALLTYSGIGLHGLISASLFRPPPRRTVQDTRDQEIKHEDNTEKSEEISNCNRKYQRLTRIIDVTLFKNPAFVLFFMARAIANYGFQTNQTHLVSRALAMGMPKQQVQFLPIFMGAFGIVGSLCSGLAGKMGFLAVFSGTGMCLHGLFQILIGFTGKNFVLNAACTSCSNFMIGFSLTLEPTLMTDIVGLHRLGRAYGLYNLILSLSALTTAPFSGWMYDISGNYNIPFYVTGSFAIVAGGLMFIVSSLSSFYAKSNPT